MRIPHFFSCCAALAASLGLASAEPAEIAVMSFNTWKDWSQVENGFDKAEAAIRKSKADLVGLQESTPESAARMAETLGWHHAEGGAGSAQILSRYPIVESLKGEGIESARFIGARIRISEKPLREVVFFNIHLDYQYYGPYAAHVPDASPAKVLEENARSRRVGQTRAALASMKSWLEAADSVPVILTGDFNVPSHLDWTAKNARAHGGVGPVAWPESLLISEAGLVDSYRLVHPNPRTEPGITWSSIHKAPEPQDRIDFVHHKGKSLRVRKSATFSTDVEVTLGAWGSDTAPVLKNTWPSDHAAVVTTYGLD